MATLRRLCVYCASSSRVDTRYRDAATTLGRLAAEAEVEIVYGGGRVGLMGLLADAALAAGGRVTGIIPSHLYEREVGHGGLSELIVVASMHERKQRMFELADAFVTLPGGLGTLDETIEIMTWRQLGLHDKPLVIVDIAGYWAPFTALVDHAIAAGFTTPATRQYFHVATCVEDVLPVIAALPPSRHAGDSALV
ncbi:MAG TPA: TIGR00730 family Rossman fold protein [Stellaceae bacterium]|nr:TIGR00730 family Rossman fold protein [Stellaceae bacterium]